MTTNQTIYGVPREYFAAWAERLERAESGFHGSVPFLKELRALMDADKVNKRQMGLVQFVEAHPIKPAAPPQFDPVAVVLPERINPPSEYAYRKGWNNCLDEVARLNSTRPTHANPPPVTEPSGTHHDNDGLDEWRKPK